MSDLYISQPEEVHIDLFTHQLTSIYKMEELEFNKEVKEPYFVRKTKLGINADPTGYGKCFKKNTKILMFDGTTKYVQHIKIGDVLLGDDSTPRNVLSLATGKEKMFRIKQSQYSDDYVVNQSHILSLKIINNELIIKPDMFIVKYLNRNTLDLEHQIFYNFENAINFFEKLELNNKLDLELSKYIQLPIQVKNMLRGYKNKIILNEQITETDPYIIGTYVSRPNFIIPNNYLYNSENNRSNLLAGIIDSTGKFLNNNKYMCNFNNIKIAKQVMFLIRSLGFFCKMIKNINSKNSIYTCSYIISFKCSNIPVRNYKNKCDNNYKCDLHTKIKVIEEEIDTYYGFVIDGNRRFLLDDFTVVHNTLSMVSLVARDKMEWDLSTPYINEKISYYSRGLIIDKEIKELQKYPTTLILVSQSIINQWKKELNYTNLTFNIITNRKSIDNINPANFDVIIVTPTMYNYLVLTHKKFAWKRFIFDEPGQVKVSNMKMLHAGFYWFVTATPTEIFAKYNNCRNNFIKDIIEPFSYDICEQLIIKNDIEIVQKSFSMPTVTNIYYECFLPILNTLDGFISSNIKTMIQAGNIQGVIDSLGGERTSNIIDLIKNKKLEEKEEIKSKIRIYKLRNDIDKINKWIEREHRIDNQIIELNNRFSNMINSQCNICLDKLKMPVLEFKCQNLFCTECLFEWLNHNTTCPLCREDINIDELIYINEIKNNNQESKTEQNERPKTKLEHIIDIIQNKQDGKFLIFSDYYKSFRPICKTLKNNNIQYAEIKGTYETISKYINKFKYEDLNVIFLNSNFNGSGLNLQEATDIILYHEMSENKKIQILGRANRIGRTIPLHVHHLQVKS